MTTSPSAGILADPAPHPYLTLKNLVRVKVDGFRHYRIENDGVPLPSITTILEHTKTADQRATLNAWKNRVGHDEAERIKNAAGSLGTVMHLNIEHHLSGLEPPGGSNIVWVKGAKLAQTLIASGIDGRVTEVWGCEVPLHYGNLYAGTTDCVGVHQGKPAIIDFKTSRRFKKREYVQDYLAQGSAYGMAHNQMYGTDIQKTVIMMMTHDGEYQEFVAEGAEWDDHAMRWSLKVQEFHEAMRSKRRGEPVVEVDELEGIEGDAESPASKPETRSNSTVNLDKIKEAQA